MSCALNWLIWVPCATLAPNGLRPRPRG